MRSLSFLAKYARDNRLDILIHATRTLMYGNHPGEIGIITYSGGSPKTDCVLGDFTLGDETPAKIVAATVNLPAATEHDRIHLHLLPETLQKVMK